MPIHQNEDGTWQWGKSGKKYKNKLDAIKQMQAIFANGYRLHTKKASYNVYSGVSLDKVKVAAIMLLYKKLHQNQLQYLLAKLNLLSYKDVDSRLRRREKQLTSPDTTVVTYLDKGVPKGYLQTIKWGDCDPKEAVGISNFYIDPLYRNKGIGSKMLRIILRLAKKKKIKQLLLGYYTDNPASHLYLRAGFKPYVILSVKNI